MMWMSEAGQDTYPFPLRFYKKESHYESENQEAAAIPLALATGSCAGFYFFLYSAVWIDYCF